MTSTYLFSEAKADTVRRAFSVSHIRRLGEPIDQVGPPSRCRGD